MSRQTAIDPKTLLSRVNDILIINLLEETMTVEQKVLDVLIPPVEGLYSTVSCKPFIEYGKEYVTLDRNAYGRYIQSIVTPTSIDEVLKLRKDLHDVNGNLVLRYSDLRLRRSFFSDKPTLPLTAMKLATTVAIEKLLTLTKYTRHVSFHTQYDLVKPEFHYLIEEDEFENVFDNLRSKIFDFVADDTWFIYVPRVHGTTLTIDKVIDYRIYRYHELEWMTAMKNNELYGDYEEYEGF